MIKHFVSAAPSLLSISSASLPSSLRVSSMSPIQILIHEATSRQRRTSCRSRHLVLARQTRPAAEFVACPVCGVHRFSVRLAR